MKNKYHEPTEIKQRTSKGLQFIGGYVNPQIADLNALIAEREGKSKARNMEQLIAVGLVLAGFEDEVLKVFPNLQFHPAYLRYKELTAEGMHTKISQD